MKKINIKKILTFLVIGIIIVAKIFGICDSNAENFSINYYDGIQNILYCLIAFVIIYIFYVIIDLFKNSIFTAILDFITSVILILTIYFIDNVIISNIFFALAIIFAVINLAISIKIKKMNNEMQEEEKKSVLISLAEFLIATVLFVIIICLVSKPISKSSNSIKINAENLSKNISLIEEKSDIYVLTEQNEETGNRFSTILNENCEELKGLEYDPYSICFAKLYKNDKQYLVGLIKDSLTSKYYFVNSNMENVCELQDVGNPNYLEDYLLDVLNYAINNKLINYEKADIDSYLYDKSPKAVLFANKEFDGKKYENDSKYNYKYFEFEKNPNYIIQVAYNLNIINHNNTNVMEQLFDLVSSNIDNNESIYNMDRNYHLINLASEEIYELDCENLLYDEYAKFVGTEEDEEIYLSGIYSFSDGKIPFYDENSTGYFDLEGQKHVDSENKLTIDTYNNYNIVYDKENSKYYIYSKIDLENPLKEYNNIYTYDSYIIGLSEEKYEILNPDDLTVLKEIILNNYESKNSINNEEEDEDYIEENADYIEYDEDTENTISLENIGQYENIEGYVSTYSNGELIVLENLETNNYILLHYDSSNKTIDVLRDNVEMFEAIYKSKDLQNSFYIKANVD